MSVRNIAHDIQTGEASLGIAVGAESMTLKYAVPLLLEPVADFLAVLDLHRKWSKPSPRTSRLMTACRYLDPAYLFDFDHAHENSANGLDFRDSRTRFPSL